MSHCDYPITQLPNYQITKLPADPVQPDASGFDRIERLFLQRVRIWPTGRARECAAGDGPMIHALGGLQGLERRGVFVLPRQPLCQTLDGDRFGRTDGFGTDRLRGIVGSCEPLPIALAGNHVVCDAADIRDHLQIPESRRTDRS
jgi:hypothetical protein